MNDGVADLDKIDESLMTCDLADEALEAAARVDGVRAITFGYCATASTSWYCLPNWAAQRSICRRCAVGAGAADIPDIAAGRRCFAVALTQLVIAGQKARSAVLMSNDPAIHAADQSAWTTGSSPAVTNYSNH
jgi:dienelactone hydrolase